VTGEKQLKSRFAEVKQSRVPKYSMLDRYLGEDCTDFESEMLSSHTDSGEDRVMFPLSSSKVRAPCCLSSATQATCPPRMARSSGIITSMNSLASARYLLVEFASLIPSLVETRNSTPAQNPCSAASAKGVISVVMLRYRAASGVVDCSMLPDIMRLD
jgi:hypothetical protein